MPSPHTAQAVASGSTEADAFVARHIVGIDRGGQGLGDLNWFVIGGHAVRCFCPYRPSVDVDFGVHEPKNSEDLKRQLRAAGEVEITERAEQMVHLRWNGINVSIFV